MPVRYRDLQTETGHEAGWQEAECINIGAGGARLRAILTEALPERIALEIVLPDKTGTLRMQGRVLRTEPAKRNTRRMEMAVKFECPGVRESLALSRLMQG